jgi:hypothetical protein
VLIALTALLSCDRYLIMFTQVNDLLRDAFTNKDKLSGQDKIFFPLEVLAGCGAGASQVVFTVSIFIHRTFSMHTFLFFDA